MVTELIFDKTQLPIVGNSYIASALPTSHVESVVLLSRA
jgi:hypothetical protein